MSCGRFVTLGLFGLFGLAGCRSTNLTTTGATQMPREANCDFLMMSALPIDGYVEVATVDYNPKTVFGVATDLADFKAKIAPDVCKAGGDAAVAYANGQGAYIKATVLKRVRAENSKASAKDDDRGQTTKPRAQPVPPAGAAGFDFGKTEGDCATLCTSSKHDWKNVAEDRFVCSGSATDIGVPVTVYVSFCSHRACNFLVLFPPKDSAPENEKTYQALLTKLESKYGAAKNHDALPSDCGQPIDPSCYESGKARRHSEWLWPSGESIIATYGKPENGERGVAIRLFYATSEQKSSLTGNGL